MRSLSGFEAMTVIGLYGGTFDPVHTGHVEIAGRAYAQHGFSKVLMIPANNPWLKQGAPVSTFQHRLRMLQIAVDGHQGLEVSDIEGRREGPTYTIDTVKQLQQEYPGCELTLLVGQDSVQTMPRWHRAEELLSLCPLAVYKRDEKNPRASEEIITDLGGQMTWINGPALTVSATELRQLIALGEDPDSKLPRGVYAYLQQQGLYKKVSE